MQIKTMYDHKVKNVMNWYITNERMGSISGRYLLYPFLYCIIVEPHQSHMVRICRGTEISVHIMTSNMQTSQYKLRQVDNMRAFCY